MFSIIKRILNIDGPKIDLVTQEAEYYPSDLIKGEVLMTAPDYRQNVKAITLNLKEFWVGYRSSSRYLQHASIPLASRFVFNPRMQYQFRFGVQLPINCRVSLENSCWRLGVIINTSGLFVSKSDFDIDVKFSKLLQRIIESIEKNTKSTEVFRGRKFDPFTSESLFVFRPPEHLKTVLQYFELSISFLDKVNVRVNILITLKDIGLINQYTTSNTQKTYSHTFDLKPIKSSYSNGQVDIAAITNFISEKLTEAISSKKV